MTHPQVRPDPAFGLLRLYDEALPHVYGYLLARCGDPCLAEDLTAESFLAAVHAARQPGAAGPSVPWLIGVARHKLADHWRRAEREQRGLRLLDDAQAADDDPWQAVVNRIRARDVLEQLGAHHRAALTLRYLDGLPVPEVASHLGRTLHATEALLVRARAAFRQVYQAQEGLAMTDPFEALREPLTPVDPDPDFARRLRTRLTREVFATQGAAMPQQTIAAQVNREPAWPPSLTPYIVVSDARRAMNWYIDVLGAQRRGEPHVNADGTIGHAEVGLGDAVLMFSEPSDLWPDVPVRAPEDPATFSHTLHLQVDDVDAITERARHSGASVEREPTDQPYGRGSVIVNPFGHRWMLLRPPPGATKLRQGDVASVTMLARDTDQAREFYEAVLGVPFSPGHPGTWRTEEIRPPLGIMPARDGEPEMQLTYRVDDIAAATGRVRAAGGNAAAPERKPYGLIAECADDQGAAFRLWQPC